MIRAILNRIDPRAAAIAGLAAGAVYVVTAEIDNRLTGNNLDDLQLLGRPLADGPEAARKIGLPIHLMNSVGLATAYAAFAADRLPGPAWFRGAAFFNIENTLLYPLTALEMKHPGIRNGEIDRYFSLKSYLQSIPRHVTFGIVMGVLYDRLRRR